MNFLSPVYCLLFCICIFLVCPESSVRPPPIRQAITAYIKAGHLYLLPSPHQRALSSVGQDSFGSLDDSSTWQLALAMPWLEAARELQRDLLLAGKHIGYDGLRCAWLPVCHSSRATTRLLLLPTMDGVHGAKHVSISELLLVSPLLEFSSVAFYCGFCMMYILPLFFLWRLRAPAW